MTQTRTGDRLADNSLVVNASGEKRGGTDWLASTGIPSIEAFRPGPGWVLFRREDRQEKVGKIVLAGKSEKDRRYRPTPARVVKVGPPHQIDSGAKVRPCLSAGDRVVLNRFCGHDIEIGGELLVIATEDDVVLIVGEDDKVSEV